MADRSAIEWTDATVNFWWGCTKVGPGCDFCYAETWDKRTGGSHWGHGVARRKIASAAKLIHRLDNDYANWAADRECIVGNAKAFGLPVPNMGIRRRVFIQSMSDLFDLEVPLEWFREAWALIKVCNRIDIQIVTKRISAVEKRLAEIGETEWPAHAGLIITVVDQPEADRDIGRLLRLKLKLCISWVGISYEPALGPLNIRDSLKGRRFNSLGEDITPGIVPSSNVSLDWVICGGESGSHARPMHPQWARDLRDQCKVSNVAFFFKQHGEWIAGAQASHLSDADLAEYPVVDLQTPGPNGGNLGNYCFKVGKKAAGRLLDGVEHNAFPAGRA